MTMKNLPSVELFLIIICCLNRRETKKSINPPKTLISLKNFNFNTKNANNSKVDYLYCDEEISHINQNSKSFDDSTKFAKKRRKISKIRFIAWNQKSIVEDNDSKIYKHKLKRMQKKESFDHWSTPLLNHKIIPRQRSKMIDWMVEWFSIFNKNNETFFLSTYLFDIFLQKTDFTLNDSDVHLIGICCIFIASKFCDIIPISLYDIWVKISHKVFGPNIIRKTEYEIMKTIDWNLNKVTPFHFISHFIKSMRESTIKENQNITLKTVDEKLMTDNSSESNNQSPMKEAYDTLEIVAIQYSKISIINEALLKFKPSEISLASLLNAIKYISETGYTWNKK